MPRAVPSWAPPEPWTRAGSLQSTSARSCSMCSIRPATARVPSASAMNSTPCPVPSSPSNCLSGWLGPRPPLSRHPRHRVLQEPSGLAPMPALEEDKPCRHASRLSPEQPAGLVGQSPSTSARRRCRWPRYARGGDEVCDAPPRFDTTPSQTTTAQFLGISRP